MTDAHDLTVEAAREAADADDLAAWVHRFLCSPGSDPSAALGLVGDDLVFVLVLLVGPGGDAIAQDRVEVLLDVVGVGLVVVVLVVFGPALGRSRHEVGLVLVLVVDHIDVHVDVDRPDHDVHVVALEVVRVVEDVVEDDIVVVVAHNLLDHVVIEHFVVSHVVLRRTGGTRWFRRRTSRRGRILRAGGVGSASWRNQER